MNKEINVVHENGQWVANYITATVLDDGGIVLYGSFPTADEAVAWGKNLTNATVHPVYVPSFNRG